MKFLANNEVRMYCTGSKFVNKFLSLCSAQFKKKKAPPGNLRQKDDSEEAHTVSNFTAPEISSQVRAKTVNVI